MEEDAWVRKRPGKSEVRERDATPLRRVARLPGAVVASERAAHKRINLVQEDPTPEPEAFGWN